MLNRTEWLLIGVIVTNITLVVLDIVLRQLFY